MKGKLTYATTCTAMTVAGYAVGYATQGNSLRDALLLGAFVLIMGFIGGIGAAQGDL